MNSIKILGFGLQMLSFHQLLVKMMLLQFPAFLLSRLCLNDRNIQLVVASKNTQNSLKTLSYPLVK